jgi:hypothetical protein
VLRLGLLPGALVAGLTACSPAAAEDATPPGTSTTRNTTTVVPDHANEIAADQEALKAALPTASDVERGVSGFTTGTDTPDGWQVQSRHDSVGREVAATGSRQVRIVCAGRGTLRVSITVRTAQGAEAVQPTTSAACTPEAATAWTSFSVAEGGAGLDVVVTPDAGTVAAAGCTVT